MPRLCPTGARICRARLSYHANPARHELQLPAITSIPIIVSIPVWGRLRTGYDTSPKTRGTRSSYQAPLTSCSPTTRQGQLLSGDLTATTATATVLEPSVDCRRDQRRVDWGGWKRIYTTMT
jgi:hypothetical protein